MEEYRDIHLNENEEVQENGEMDTPVAHRISNFVKIAMKLILRLVGWLLWPSALHIFLFKCWLSAVVIVVFAMLFDEYQERTIGCPVPNDSWQDWLKGLVAELRSHFVEDCARKKRSLFLPRFKPQDCKWCLITRLF